MILGVQREALRKFNRGETESPHDRSRELLGTRFLEYGRAPRPWRVAEEVSPLSQGPPLGELRMIFTGEGRDGARRHVRKLFADAGLDGDVGVPAWAVGLRTWLARSVDAAFAGEPTLYEKRRRKRPDPPGAPSQGSPPEPRPGAKASGAAPKPDSPRRRRRGPDGDGTE